MTAIDGNTVGVDYSIDTFVTIGTTIDFAIDPRVADNRDNARFTILVTAQVLLGDLNCDGVVDLLDVAPFVDLIINGGFSPKGDFDGDGAVNLLDVAPFVASIAGS